MKPITTQLQTLFTQVSTSQQPGMATAGLYQFNLITGGVLYYASSDVDVYLKSASSGGNSFWTNQLFTAGGVTGPFFDKSSNHAKMHQKIGVEVDTLVFDVQPGTSMIQGFPFLTAVREGVFDGAELLYLGAYWPFSPTGYVTPIVPTGTILKFTGRVAEVTISNSLATFSVNSHLELLNQNMPRNLYQSMCVNTLYDASCTLNRASFAIGGTVLTGSTAILLNATLAAATGYYDQGSVVFTSGANNGISRTVKSYVNGSPSTVSLIAPLAAAPVPGDTFTIYPGCDKSQSTCTNKFSNLVNFRGFPYVPDNTTAA